MHVYCEYMYCDALGLHRVGNGGKTAAVVGLLYQNILSGPVSHHWGEASSHCETSIAQTTRLHSMAVASSNRDKLQIAMHRRALSDDFNSGKTRSVWVHVAPQFQGPARRGARKL